MGYGEFINKRVILIFDDGQSIMKKVGKLIKITDKYIEFQEKNKTAPQLIPHSRIIRIEGDSGNDD